MLTSRTDGVGHNPGATSAQLDVMNLLQPKSIHMKGCDGSDAGPYRSGFCFDNHLWLNSTVLREAILGG